MARICLFICGLLISVFAHAAHHNIDLTVDYKNVNFTGTGRQAMAVNQQIPAPTLHFKQGDLVTINVTNLMNVETALHWHGLLVPWQMDGVKGVTQNGIKKGETFKYRFKLEQSGTYWYHAHAGLQEQSGIYGAIVIDPLKKPAYYYNKEHVIVLSDWINTNPDQVLANLKKDGDYYSPRFPLQPSLAKFIHDYRQSSPADRVLLWNDYQSMQQMRMSIYDFSDVAYDAFLLNGKTKLQPWRALVKVGDVVRLRFIGAGASTIFHVKIPDTIMQVVHLQGNDVKPYHAEKFSIAPGETVDVLVKITQDRPYIIYAESIDTVGAAYGALVTNEHQALNLDQVKPFPEPQPVTRTMMAMMMGNKMTGTLPRPHQEMSHEGHDMDMSGMDMGHDMSHMKISHTMPTEPSVHGDKISPPSDQYVTSMGTSYDHAVGAVKTNDPNKPVAGVINMELFGYMDNYIWFINGVPEYNAKPIVLQPGKRYRFVFTNTSMMHHPMHIHGHWFILRKGDNEYDPLLHTIDVPPGATITADLDTDASGQWIFHCHLLYHMMSGMTRIFQYSTLLELIKEEIKPEDTIKKTAYINRPIVRVDEVRPINHELVHHPMAHEHGRWLASYIDAGVSPFDNEQQISLKVMYGPDTNKLQLFMNDAEIGNGSIEQADLDIFYWRQLYQFMAVKGGINYFYRPAAKPYFQPGIGLEGLLPYFIETDLRAYYYGGSAKLDLEIARDTQITNNFFVRLEIRGVGASKTATPAGIGSGLNYMRYTVHPFYRLMPGLDAFVEYEYQRNYGNYQTIQQQEGESLAGGSYTVGLSVIL